MTKDDAEMWARVAKRIGLSDVQIVAGDVMHDIPKFPLFNESDIEFMSVPFNPPDNPADERLLWDWLSVQRISLIYWSDGSPEGINLFRHESDERPALVSRGKSDCRVTAMGKAIDGLQE